jgi:thymidylate synthase
MSVYNKLTTIYAARSIDGGFGMSDGSLPWTCPQDLDLFAKITKHTNSRFRNTMFMGTTTFSEIGDLPGRHIIQVSKQIKTPELLWMENGGIGYSDQVFIAGGKKLFSSVFESGFRPDCIILSTIERECPHADIFLRDSDLHLDQYVLFSFKQFDGFRVHVYVKNTDHPKIPSGVLEFVPHHDQMYANLVRNILDNGERVQDRTGNGTVRMFAPPPIKFDLGVVFPIITTKRVFWRGVCEELWWFLRGSTDSKELERVGVHIWSGNTSRDFLDQRGLEDYEPGQTGPIYGHQWRHWNGDQLQNLVDGIQRDPFSRRHLLSAWNVGDLDKMVLPPCHCFAQFSVTQSQRLDCHVYMRSCDVALGLPFNIASYGVLVHIIAVKTKLKPGTMTFSFGDAHVYIDHIEKLTEQIDRFSKPAVVLKRVDDVSFDAYTNECIATSPYFHHNAVKMNMAI